MEAFLFFTGLILFVSGIIIIGSEAKCKECEHRKNCKYADPDPDPQCRCSACQKNMNTREP